MCIYMYIWYTCVYSETCEILFYLNDNWPDALALTYLDTRFNCYYYIKTDEIRLNMLKVCRFSFEVKLMKL